MSQPTTGVVVVGAGVVGLTTAVLLAERGDDVRVLAAEGPLDTTSAVASAMVGPNLFPAGEPAFEWERRGREVFTQLAEDPGSGVVVRSGLLAARQEPPFPMALDGRPVDVAGPSTLPDGFGWGFRTQTPLVDMVPYLRYLVGRLEAAGTRVEIGRLGSLDDVSGLAPAVMNCSGLGSRELAGTSVRPSRGQHVVVANPGIDEFFMEAPFGPAWAAFWPHGDRVVLGATATDDAVDDPRVRAEQTRQIVARCAEIDPRLAEVSVLGTQVGLRPRREDGVHLAAERRGDTVYVHNVGHGGSGVSQSWGTAEDAVRLLDDSRPLS
ncbi:FAD-dependent oxidoreductase [Georgenia subflava]|uniref:D-amino-acid oxidase n=1 Tax=Georgenia subflava TaxID=1622177 RepID=A0A6N7EGN9_9MICO|nr:FAD-dependent oxidoreductase [Georgenia subflava]MPV35857.1 FAD-dependent oxidoreductase [Georgenia subflava]